MVDGTSITDYEYELPLELIAQEPLPGRGESRLMVLDRTAGTIVHSRFAELDRWLAPGDLLIMNDSRVLKARLIGKRRDTGGNVELLVLEPVGDDLWRCLARPARRLPTGVRVDLDPDTAVTVTAEEPDGRRIIRMADGPSVMERLGQMPLPPYITRPLADEERYQTVVARRPGSAAAPTAGLHVTTGLLSRLRTRGIAVETVTLHVGPDTFLPIRTDDISDHQMHSEWIGVSDRVVAAIADAKRRGGRVVALGTTVMRTLESVPTTRGDMRPYQGATRLFIKPGFRFRVVDAMITNFHLPRSTLLVLVAAFAGRDFIMSAYRQAMAHRYRFYSFGDAMLIV